MMIEEYKFDIIEGQGLIWVGMVYERGFCPFLYFEDPDLEKIKSLSIACDKFISEHQTRVPDVYADAFSNGDEAC